MPPEVLAFGALNVDRLVRVDFIPGSGAETSGREVELSPGGAAGNFAAGMARLGLRSGLVARVGSDPHGDFLLRALRRERVDVRGVRRVGGFSGRVTAMVDRQGERALIVEPGVNDGWKGLPPSVPFGRARWLHLTSFACTEGDGPLRVQAAAARLCAGRVSLDPGNLYARRGERGLRPLLRRTAVLLPSEEELQKITSGAAVPGAEALAEGGMTVAVKMGPRGCFATNGRESARLPSLAAKVVDTTGAGDAFDSGFIFGRLRGHPLGECALLGSLAAASCVARAGAWTGLPSRAELLRRFETARGRM
ncbi:MAG: PfkB family carbohydrate kinase [Halobacteria archaeon]